MAKELFKRLLHCLAASIGASLLYGLLNYQTVHGLEQKQGAFIFMTGLGFLSLLSFVFALPAFLNLNANIRQSPFTSMLSFFFMPLLLLIWLCSIISSYTQRHLVVKDFEAAIPTAVFCVVLAFQFYKFRQKYFPNEN